MMKNMPNAMPFISKSGIHYSWETVLEYFSHELWPPVIVAAAVFLFPSLYHRSFIVDIVTIRLGQRISFLVQHIGIALLPRVCVLYMFYINTEFITENFQSIPLFIVQSWFFRSTISSHLRVHINICV